jgi:hypothetical protein
MQNKHTDRALLESSLAQAILEDVLLVNDIHKVRQLPDGTISARTVGADIAPWSDGRIQSFDKDPSPRLMASHVAVHTAQVIKEMAGFNGKDQTANANEVAKLAYQVEKISAEKQLSRPSGVTNSEAFIRSHIAKKGEQPDTADFDKLTFTGKDGETMNGAELTVAAVKALEIVRGANEERYNKEEAAIRDRQQNSRNF